MKNVNVPVLRFKGFDSDWEKSSLGDVSSNIMYGLNSSAISFDGLHKYIRITDIDENSRKYKPSPLTSPDGNIDEKFKLTEGDLLFTRTGASVGKTYLYEKNDGNVYFAGFLIRFFIFNANPYFIFLQTFGNRYNNWVHIMSMRSGQPGINAEEYKSFKISIPKIEEQKKIAEFLTSVDKKIDQLTKKKELLEKYKKGLMQKIFSQELRFKNDNGEFFDDWDFKKSSEIFKNHTNKNHDGDLPILSVTQDKGVVLRDSIDIEIKSSEQSIKSYKIIEKGDFVISLRSFQGGIEYSNIKGISSPAYTVLKNKLPINSNFFKYYLKKESFIEELSATVIGIRDGKQISFDAFSTLILPYRSPLKIGG